MDRCKTRSPHEQYDATAIGSVVLPVNGLAVTSCSMEPVYRQLALDSAHVVVSLTLPRQQNMM